MDTAMLVWLTIVAFAFVLGWVSGRYEERGRVYGLFGIYKTLALNVGWPRAYVYLIGAVIRGDRARGDDGT